MRHCASAKSGLYLAFKGVGVVANHVTIIAVVMKKLLIFCCIVLASHDVWSCNITIDSITENAENNDTQLDWPWTITIDSIDGSDSESCLINQTVHCKTLGFVLNNITEYSTRTQLTCVKVVLGKNSPNHVIPRNALALTDISLYFVSEGNAVITCENINVGISATAWSIQNASFVVFKSLHFSNCNQRLEIANVTDVHFENVKIR